jgi:hypothetical protein
MQLFRKYSLMELILFLVKTIFFPLNFMHECFFCKIKYNQIT